MSTKIGVDGKPFDPAEKARNAIELLREFATGKVTPQEALDVHAALNAIADRLATCDALEQKPKHHFGSVITTTFCGVGTNNAIQTHDWEAVTCKACHRLAAEAVKKS